MKNQFELLAKYNQKMNQNIYTVCHSLNEFEMRKHRGAFFGSIINTLNHILVGDIIWLKRIANQYNQLNCLSEINSFDTPNSLSQILFDDFSILEQARLYIDSVFISLIAELNDNQLTSNMQYQNINEETFNQSLCDVLLHIFNHQTHHRGQVSTLLSQNDMDYGCTDLITVCSEINESV